MVYGSGAAKWRDRKVYSDESKVSTKTVQQQTPAATVLAAGLGSRLGFRPKAMLEVGGATMLERVVMALRGAGVQMISVVIGPYREQLLPMVEGCGAYPILHQLHNPSFVESQRLALDNHSSRVADLDLMLVLGDLVLLTASDVLLLLGAWSQRAPSVHAQRPSVNGVRGHPLLLSSWAVRQVCTLPRALGVRDWLDSHTDVIESVPTHRQGYVSDLDTPADLTAMRDRLDAHPFQ